MLRALALLFGALGARSVDCLLTARARGAITKASLRDSKMTRIEYAPGMSHELLVEALVLSKVPELKERIEGEKNRLKKKEFLNVLKFLVEKSQIDHIWSSACDAPPNCIHEWGPVNNHFKDFKYQQAKLRRYGATVARVSAKWMDECIVAEGKCLSLA